MVDDRSAASMSRDYCCHLSGYQANANSWNLYAQISRSEVLHNIQPVQHQESNTRAHDEGISSTGASCSMLEEWNLIDQDTCSFHRIPDGS